MGVDVFFSEQGSLFLGGFDKAGVLGLYHTVLCLAYLGGSDIVIISVWQAVPGVILFFAAYDSVSAAEARFFGDYAVELFYLFLRLFIHALVAFFDTVEHFEEVQRIDIEAVELFACCIKLALKLCELERIVLGSIPVMLVPVGNKVAKDHIAAVFCAVYAPDHIGGIMKIRNVLQACEERIYFRTAAEVKRFGLFLKRATLR